MTTIYLTPVEILAIAEFQKAHSDKDTFELHQEFLSGAGCATEITCDGYKKDITDYHSI